MLKDFKDSYKKFADRLDDEEDILPRAPSSHDYNQGDRVTFTKHSMDNDVKTGTVMHYRAGYYMIRGDDGSRYDVGVDYVRGRA